MVFPTNPGPLRQIEINTFLDGKRTTLQTNKDGVPVGIFVYPDGFSGESDEYFTELCSGVDVNLLSSNNYHFLSGLTALEVRLLKQCLADADGYPDAFSEQGRVLGNNYTWDFGNVFNPHLIRLVDLTDSPITDLCNGTDNSIRGGNFTCRYGDGLGANFQRPPGFFVPLIFDPVDQLFKIFTRPAMDFGPVTLFSIFTTTGTAQMVSNEVVVSTDPNIPYSSTLFTHNSSSNYSNSGFDGYVDCGTNPHNDFGALDCVEKGNLVFFLDPSFNSHSIKSNPKYLNLYTVLKIFRDYPSASPLSRRLVNKIVLDKSINSEWIDLSVDAARIYLFKPSNAFRYVSECSNRGNCDDLTGICNCFEGFTAQACSSQNNILF